MLHHPHTDHGLLTRINTMLIPEPMLPPEPPKPPPRPPGEPIHNKMDPDIPEQVQEEVRA